MNNLTFHLKILLGTFVFVALAASLLVSTRLTGQVSNQTDAFQACQNVDVNKDGVISSGDEVGLRAVLQDPNSIRVCGVLTGAEQIACQNLDITKDGILNTGDLLALRKHMQDPGVLKICKTSTVDPLAQCKAMDMTNDGIVSTGDELVIRGYIENPGEQKICAYISDPAKKQRCQLYDIDKNGYVNTEDSAALRAYFLTPGALRICKTIQSSSSSSSVSSVDACQGLHSKDLITEMNYQIDSRIDDIEATSANVSVWSTRDVTSIGWTRSATVWTNRGEKPLDLTGISPWNSHGTTRMAGTLISPRHVVFAHHYQIGLNKQIGFVDKDNNMVVRTLIAKQQIPNSDGMVGLLDADVPPSVTYYPVITEEELLAHMPPLKPGQIVPSLIKVLMFNQKDRAIVSELFQIGADNAIYAPYRITLNNLDGSQSIKYGPAPKMIRPIMHFDSFEIPIITGDSGDAVFLVINNRLVLLATHHSPSSGPYYGALIDELNQVMRDLGGGYQATEFDLSCFTKP